MAGPLAQQPQRNSFGGLLGNVLSQNPEGVLENPQGGFGQFVNKVTQSVDPLSFLAAAGNGASLSQGLLAGRQARLQQASVAAEKAAGIRKEKREDDKFKLSKEKHKTDQQRTDLEQKRLERDMLPTKTLLPEDPLSKRFGVGAVVQQDPQGNLKVLQAAPELSDKAKETARELAIATDDTLGRFSSLRDTLTDPSFPDAVGPMDQVSAGVGAMFGTESGVMKKRIERLASFEGLKATGLLKGAISEKELEIAFRTKPEPSDREEHWLDWYNDDLLPVAQRAYRRDHPGAELPPELQLIGAEKAPPSIGRAGPQQQGGASQGGITFVGFE